MEHEFWHVIFILNSMDIVVIMKEYLHYIKYLEPRDFHIFWGFWYKQMLP